MKIRTGIVLAGMLSASLVCAENLTQTNMRKAQGIIDEAVAAYGGDDHLSGLSSIIVHSESINIATGQSRKAEPPWDRNTSSGFSAVDMEKRQFVTSNSGSGGGFEFDNGTIINGDESVQMDFRAGTVAPIAEPDFDTASGPFTRVTPALLVRQVRDRAQNAYYLGDTTIDGKTFDVIGFSMSVGPAISLYFDRDSRLLRRSDRVLPGFGLVEYRFDDYELSSGIPFNKTFELYLNGEQNMVRKNTRTLVDEPIDELLVSDSGLQQIPPIVPDELQRREIADDVYLVGGAGTYAMFIEMDEYVIAVGGTAGIPDRIRLLREVVADKPIRYGVLTHHHFDHVLGVQPYEETGATVIASTAHESVVRDAAANGELLKFKGVDDRFDLSTATRRVEIIDIGPTAHTEHLLVTWLPDDGLVFEADHFAMPQNGPVPPAVSSTRTFADALDKHGIRPKIIASAHSPKPGTMDDLRQALGKDVVLLSQQ